jgi:predicted Zn-dependent peptidase
MLQLIAEVTMNPLFPESEVARLKNDMIRNLNIQKTQPANIAFELFSKVLYPDHPYGRVFPNQDIIESFTAEKSKTFYDKNFGALRTHVYVVGLFDEDEVEKTLRESFDTWMAGTAPEINIPETESKPMIYFANRPGAPQSVLNIGLPAIDPSNQDYLPLMLTNGLLGGSFTSRITKNIREDKGYTYSPYSQVASRYRTAYWMQFAEVGTDVTVPSLKEIFYEIKRLTDEVVSEGELSGIKNYMSGLFVLRNSTLSGIIGQLAFIDLHGLDLSYLNNYVRNIHSVTAADVQNIMKKYINPSNMTIVVAGDREKIGKEIAKFGKISD